MNYTLREAVESIVKELDKSHNGELRTYGDLEAKVRALLDAHPDNSETEWGVQYSDSEYTQPHASKESADWSVKEHNAIDMTNWKQPFDMMVVSRRAAGPWERAK